VAGVLVRSSSTGLLFLTVLAGCSRSDAPPTTTPEGDATPASETWDGDVVAATRALRPQEGTERDWEIFRTTVTQAWEGGVDLFPIGEAMVEIGLSLLGTPYGPGTLEVAGQEDVVVNLEELDCVTFVENTLAMARFIRENDPGILDFQARSREAYRRALQQIRYRNGRVEGYPSRLHYFSDWIRDNEAKGLVRELTEQLGGELETDVIDFMSTHPEAYRQMASTANVTAIIQTEVELSRIDRFLIPEQDIPNWVSSIKNGDIIAATSTVDGLDVAHTGLAYWQNGELHLLHAPLVGGVVEVSRLPLAERILRIDGQDGIRVVRPVESGAATAGGSLP
jgi:hypothetical protein